MPSRNKRLVPLVGQGIQSPDNDCYPKSLAQFGRPAHGRKPPVQETAKNIIFEEMDDFVKAGKRRKLLRKAGKGGEKKYQRRIGNCRTGIDKGASETSLCSFRTFCDGLSVVFRLVLQCSVPFCKNLYHTHRNRTSDGASGARFFKDPERFTARGHDAGIHLGTGKYGMGWNGMGMY